MEHLYPGYSSLDWCDVYCKELTPGAVNYNNNAGSKFWVGIFLIVAPVYFVTRSTRHLLLTQHTATLAPVAVMLAMHGKFKVCFDLF
jgi:hypothetical protein